MEREGKRSVASLREVTNRWRERYKNSRRCEKRNTLGKLQGCLAGFVLLSRTKILSSSRSSPPPPPLLLQLLFILSRSICIIFKFKYTEPAELPPPSPPHLSPLGPSSPRLVSCSRSSRRGPARHPLPRNSPP